MSPLFPIFFAFVLYIILLGISLAIFAPMLFMDTKKVVAKKVIGTVLISFPCLLASLIVFGILFLIPGFAFSLVLNAHHIFKFPATVILTIGMLIFGALVAVSALYLWYFMSKILYRKIDNKPVQEAVNKDKLIIFIRSFLVKDRLIGN